MDPPKESQPALFLSPTSLPVRCYIILTYMYFPPKNLFPYLSQPLSSWLSSCRQRRHIMHEQQGVKIATTIQRVFRFFFTINSCHYQHHQELDNHPITSTGCPSEVGASSIQARDACLQAPRICQYCHTSNGRSSNVMVLKVALYLNFRAMLDSPLLTWNVGCLKGFFYL